MPVGSFFLTVPVDFGPSEGNGASTEIKQKIFENFENLRLSSSYEDVE